MTAEEWQAEAKGLVDALILASYRLASAQAFKFHSGDVDTYHDADTTAYRALMAHLERRT